MTTEQLAPIRRLLEEALRQLGATENNDGAGKAQPGPPRHPKDEVTFDLVIAPNETHIEALRRVIRKELHYVSANKAFVDMRFRGYIRQLLDELDLAAPAAQPEKEPLALKAERAERTTTQVPCPPPSIYWRCFYCGYTAVEKDQAERHFGGRFEVPECRVVAHPTFKALEAELVALKAERAAPAAGEAQPQRCEPCEDAHALIEKWRERASSLDEYPCGLSHAHGVRLALRKCAEELETLLAAPGEAQPFHESRSPDGDGRNHVDPASHDVKLYGERERPDTGACGRLSDVVRRTTPGLAGKDASESDYPLDDRGAIAGAGSEPADSHQRDCVAIQTEKPFVGCPEGVWVVIQRDENGEMSLKIAEFYSKELAEAYAAHPGRLAAGEAQPDKCPRCGSPKPHLHPAMEFEVQTCPHPFHSIRTNQNPPFDFDAADPGRRAPAQEPNS